MGAAGGRIEGDEVPEACLVREFKEETGLEVTVGPCAGSGILTIAPPHVLSVTEVQICAYGCHVKPMSLSADQILISNEHQGWRWIPVADLGAWRICPTFIRPFSIGPGHVSRSKRVAHHESENGMSRRTS